MIILKKKTKDRGNKNRKERKKKMREVGNRPCTKVRKIRTYLENNIF